MSPATIDGGEIQAVTIDGQAVEQITMDGDVVWKAVEVVDDFEQRDPDTYWDYVDQVEKSDTNLVTPGMRGTDRAWRHTDFVNVHLAGANAVDRGPQPGDRFEFWFYIADITGSPVIDRFEFSSENVDDTECYRIEFEANTPEPEFQIEDVAEGEIDTDAGVEFQADQFYSVTVEWEYHSSQVRARAFDEPGHSPKSNWVSLGEPAPQTGSYDNPGISLFSDNNNTLIWDEIRILDSE